MHLRVHRDLLHIMGSECEGIRIGDPASTHTSQRHQYCTWQQLDQQLSRGAVHPSAISKFQLRGLFSVRCLYAFDSTRLYGVHARNVA